MTGRPFTSLAIALSLAFPASVLAQAPTAVAASPAAAQPTASLDTIRRELARGDTISLVRTQGDTLTGRLLRIDERDLEIRIAKPGGRSDVTVPLSAIESLVRERDSVRNGTLIGAGIGAGFFATMFGIAIAVDRNEMDEWAPGYLAGGALITGLGALVGAFVDALHSKPSLRFDRAGAGPKVRLSARPTRGRGVSVTVSLSR